MPRKIKSITDIRAEARKHTGTALKTLIGIAGSPKCTDSARVTAAQALLDRGWGKAAQPHIGGDEDDPPIKAIIRVIQDAQNAQDRDI